MRAESALLVLILAFMAGMAFLQVALRQFFSMGILWGDTLLRHLVLWVGFLGAAIAASEGKHFAWEAAAHAPGKKGAAMRLASNLAAALICGFLVWVSLDFLHEEKASGAALFTAGAVTVPAWALALIVPAGFALVLLHSLMRAALAAGELKR